MERPEVRYATSTDGLSIAYHRHGAGDVDVLYLPGTVSHLDAAWDLEGMRYFMERLGKFCRLLKFDKRGTGLSDRSLGTGTPEARIDDARAVLDAENIDRAVVLGHSEGGTLAALFAALHPDRVSKLILFNAYAYGPLCENHPNPAAARHVAQKMLDRLQRDWGTGRALSMWADGNTDLEAAARYERSACTPAGIVDYMKTNFAIDVRPVLGSIQAPTLIVHGTRDELIPFFFAEIFQENIPNAQLVPVDMGHGNLGPGGDHPALDAMERWLTGTTGSSAAVHERLLAAVLFTDIVGSTKRAAGVGDEAWASILDRHDEVCRRSVDRLRGEYIESTGDGMLAIFDGPGRAIECAKMIAANLEGLDIQIRGGIHTGEIERRGDGVTGIGVHIAARILSHAAEGEIWVSSTVPSLVVGSGHTFTNRGMHLLKGVPGEWELASVD